MNDSTIEKKLYEQLKIVQSYLVRMGATKEDAEDIAQDTAYKFLLYIDSVDIRNVEGWLFRVATNQYYDFFRKKARHKNILLKFNYNELFEEFTPEVAAIQLEIKQELDELLSKLKPKYREFLILKYSTGLKMSEIASLYNMSEGSVKTNLHRARSLFIKEYRRMSDGK
ncbi:RNA polymerase sigma factor [Bacillus sp. BGMRC 2118]|nr:RNA polymerase sigma factor [Bacillus sp. BGMRC 2118]